MLSHLEVLWVDEEEEIGDPEEGEQDQRGPYRLPYLNHRYLKYIDELKRPFSCSSMRS
jgi:hypothetical protein